MNWKNVEAILTELIMSVAAALILVVLLGIIAVTVIQQSPAPPRNAVARAIADYAGLPFRPDECLTPAAKPYRSAIILRVTAARDYDYVVERIDVKEPPIALHVDSTPSWRRMACPSRRTS